MTPRANPDHYSYTFYADASNARRFDDRRFGGPIGSYVAESQAATLVGFIGRIEHRRILDVGTGTGRAALFFARSGAEVTGVDASEEMLKIARERAVEESVDVRFQVGDAHALTFPDRSCDVAVCLRVVMHTPEWRRVVSELCRVADGLVVIDYPSSRSVAFLESLGRRAASTAGLAKEPYRTFSDRTIDDAFERSGFRVRARHRQFVLPIALHKLIGSRRFTQWCEGIFDRIGLLALFGSPVTIVAERCASS
jgi:SAM-dependent methyltransferase